MANNLNEQQQKAVRYPLKPVMVMAGAGTGKTTVLTHRIIYLINNLHISPHRILAITFTNKAADEINKRIKKEIDLELGWAGTFHKICIQILRQEIHLLGRNQNFKIVDEEECKTILKSIYEDNNFDKTLISYTNALYMIGKMKLNLWTLDNLNNFDVQKRLDLVENKKLEMFKKIFVLYNKKFSDYNCLDFDDILNFTNEIFDNFPEVQKKWSNHFDYILVDEFQDTNKTQFELIKHLANENFNVFVVGDDDQIIYTFRGADSKVINKFVNYKPNEIEILKLEENYRSTNQILNVANQLISHNSDRVNKQLFSNKPDHIKPIIHVSFSTDEEASFVAKKITELKKSGVDYNRIAILYRSKHLSRSYEQMLMTFGVPYNLYGGFKFYQTTEIKDIIAYLNVINSYDELSLRRIINLPKRKISDETVKNVLDYANNKNLSFWDALVQHNQIDILTTAQHQAIQNFINLISELKEKDHSDIYNFVSYLIKRIEYLEYAKSHNSKALVNIESNLEELKNSMIIFKNKHPDDWSLTKYLHEIAIYSSLDDRNKLADAVTMSTIHSVKGLEFDYVFLVSFNDGDFPSKHSIDSEYQIIEERRLAYVAITRAKHELYICTNSGFNYNEKKCSVPSRFIREIEKDSISYTNPTIKNISNFDTDWFDSKNKTKLDKTKQYEEKENNYHINDRIIHITFGEGVIIAIDGDILEIFFNNDRKTRKIIYNHKAIKRIIK